MRISLSLLFCAALSCASASQTNPTDNPNDLAVRGRVVQDPGGQPLRKVDIRLLPRGGQKPEEFTATSDAEGKFQIEHVKPGRYIAVLQRPGFVQPARNGARLVLNSPADAGDLVLRMQSRGGDHREGPR